jgi:hypothetical protein
LNVVVIVAEPDVMRRIAARRTRMKRNLI